MGSRNADLGKVALVRKLLDFLFYKSPTEVHPFQGICLLGIRCTKVLPIQGARRPLQPRGRTPQALGAPKACAHGELQASKLAVCGPFSQ